MKKTLERGSNRYGLAIPLVSVSSPFLLKHNGALPFFPTLTTLPPL